ncbi:hypothetical protein FRB94_000833 [Tulasnella sp. JGI-2019a]|nr:hypothetical protein FRB94_000833 [Tulasnella sp. JGI-2019a]
MGNQVECPVCGAEVDALDINPHLDSGCTVVSKSLPRTSTTRVMSDKRKGDVKSSKSGFAPIFSQAKAKRHQTSDDGDGEIEFLDQPSTSTRPPHSLHNGKNRMDATASLGAPSSPSATRDEPPPSKRLKTTSANLRSAAPLAERMRPDALDDVVGHEHMTAKDSLLRSLIENGGTGSMILWGPAGCGKTTLARLLAKSSGSRMVELSATSSGTAEVRGAFEEARNALKLTGRRTILFMDEIHRFNKSQQDLFLPYVEQGLVQLIGATTENPSFKLNNALLSRCRVFVLERLTDENIREIVLRTLRKLSPGELIIPKVAPVHGSQSTLRGSSPPSMVEIPPTSAGKTPSTSLSSAHPQITQKVVNSIVSFSTGDARTALSLLELAIAAAPTISEEPLLASLKKSVVSRYDRSGDDRYDMISALHKSVRGSDGSAAMYWLARMLTAGEDPLYVARRLIVMASEDIGLANNDALPLALSTYNACTIIGMPECRINLAHCVAYLAESPKSTRSYEAYNRAEEAAKEDSTVPVPVHIRNAPTELMKELGYGQGYLYNPGYAHPVYNEFLPLQYSQSNFLRKAGDMDGKKWDEDLLASWEWRANGGKDWEGRPPS